MRKLSCLGVCVVLGLSAFLPNQTRAAPLVTVTETAQGQFTLANNSNNWFVYGFEIERPAFTSNPTTTQPGWTTYTCTLTCNVTTFSGFGYVLGGFASPFISGIAPHTSSSNFFFTDLVPHIVDGTSNTIILSEPLDIVVFAAAHVASIADGTSNTIVFGENGPPLRFEFHGSVSPGITDGTSNTIFIGETQVTPIPATFSLFAGGVGAIGLLVRRRKRRK
ncbi:MAG: hypothetical protein ACXWKA_18135 [Xanthobacteraceae bacterium]